MDIYQEYSTVGILADEFDERETNSEDEGIDDYKKGGYHPIFIGEVLNDRYVILQKLGWGHFSTVWLSRDTKHNTFVAIKVQKSASHYLEAAFDEVEILQKAVKCANDPQFREDLKDFYNGERTEFGVDDCHVVQLLNAFIYNGPYGRHFCMVFEILGVNLLEIIKRYEYKGIPVPICREMGKQILIGLHYLHKYCGIIHTDLKPENVMVCLSKEELKEIYESGQLNLKNKLQRKLKLLRKRLAMLRGESVSDDNDEIEIKISEMETEEAVRSRKDTFESIIVGHSNVEESGNDAVSELENESRVFATIRTEEELQREFDRIVAEKSLNQKEKKNLKKKLKKKLKKIKVNGESSHQANIVKSRFGGQPLGRSVSRPKLLAPELHPNFAKSGLSPGFKIKIADLGNGCWVHHHFQPEIQTRQYRSPEVILGINYNETADLWSFGCMFYEMITGEFLFDPRKTDDWSKSTDHLALMMEVLRKFPRNYSTIGTNSKKFIQNDGSFRKIPSLFPVTISEMLIRKYKAKTSEAREFQRLLLPMLEIYPQRRATAVQVLKSDWFERDIIELFEDPLRETDEEFKNHTEVSVNMSFFDVAVDEEDFFGDRSGCSEDKDTAETLDESFFENDQLTDPYEKQCRNYDREFRNVYVGFADGIDLNALDNTGNWQFDANN